MISAGNSVHAFSLQLLACVCVLSSRRVSQVKQAAFGIPEHFVTESNILKRPFCYLFSQLLSSRRGITVEHPWGEGGDTAVHMEYGMNTLVALAGGCSQPLFLFFLSQQWYQHDIVDHSPQRPDFASGKNVSG